MRRYGKASFAGSTQGSGTRRGLFGLVCLCVLGLAAFLGSGAPSAGAAEACPNEALRQQQAATKLPDCRAYEQVSPTEKSNNNVNLFEADLSEGPAVSSPSGDGALFMSLGAFAGSPGGASPATYAAARESDSWKTSPLSPPVEVFPFPITNSVVVGATPDFSKQLVASGAVLAPGGVPENVNLYVHDSSDDSYEFVGTEGEERNPSSVHIGEVSSPDGVHWFFAADMTLESTPPPVGGVNNLYEYANGELTLAGVLPGGAAAPGGSELGARAQSLRSRHAVSDDLSRVYWSTPSIATTGPAKVYVRENGESTLVTERESDESTQEGIFYFATPAHGSHAFLTSDDQLTSDASPSGNDLYRYDADAEDLVDLTPTGSSAGVEGLLGISDDGSYVYFQATGELAPGATGGEHNIYVWHDGEIRLIATSATGFLNVSRGFGEYRVSPNGRYLGFALDGALTGPNPQPDPGVAEAYVYDYAGDSLECASCASVTGVLTGDVLLQVAHEADVGPNGVVDGFSHNVLDDGRFFFSSPDPLAPGDANGRYDAYQYSGGQARLISTGQSPEPSWFSDATPDGGNVFLLTFQGLVGQDKDSLADLYDARVDGGIAAQNPVPQPGCEGDACQGASAPPQVTPPATAAVVGRGNVSEKQNCNKLGREAKKLSQRAKRLRKNAKQTQRNGKSGLAKKRNRKATRLAKQARSKSKSAKKCRKANRRASK